MPIGSPSMRTLPHRPAQAEAKAAAPAPAPRPQALRGRLAPGEDARAALRCLVDEPAQRKAAPLDTGYGALIAMATTAAQQRSEPKAMPAQRKLEMEAAFGAGAAAASGAAVGVNPTGMPAPVRAKMEAAFGADFSGVRVRPGSARAAALGAAAYTQGSEIHVAPGQWAPETTRGQEILGHELAHVVQQREGRVQATAQYFK